MLNRLYLSHVVPGNNIGDEGATSFGNSLEKNSVLTSLNLNSMCPYKKNKLQLTYAVADNNIGDEGAISLGNSLEKNSVLTSLKLKGMC